MKLLMRTEKEKCACLKKCIALTVDVHELLNSFFSWLLFLLRTNMSSLSLGMGFC